MKRTVNKQVLQNWIKHTDSQNRVWEESEMWKQRSRGARELEAVPPAAKDPISGYHGNTGYWNKKLMELKEKDTSRWGHSGYKELYPEDFDDKPSKPASKASKKRHHSSSESETDIKTKETKLRKSSDRKKLEHKKPENLNQEISENKAKKKYYSRLPRESVEISPKTRKSKRRKQSPKHKHIEVCEPEMYRSSTPKTDVIRQQIEVLESSVNRKESVKHDPNSGTSSGHLSETDMKLSSKKSRKKCRHRHGKKYVVLEDSSSSKGASPKKDKIKDKKSGDQIEIVERSSERSGKHDKAKPRELSPQKHGKSKNKTHESSVKNKTHESSVKNKTHESSVKNKTHESSVKNKTHESSVKNKTHESSVKNKTHESSVKNKTHESSAESVKPEKRPSKTKKHKHSDRDSAENSDDKSEQYMDCKSFSYKRLKFKEFKAPVPTEPRRYETHVTVKMSVLEEDKDSLEIFLPGSQSQSRSEDELIESEQFHDSDEERKSHKKSKKGKKSKKEKKKKKKEKRSRASRNEATSTKYSLELSDNFGLADSVLAFDELGDIE